MSYSCFNVTFDTGFFGEVIGTKASHAIGWKVRPVSSTRPGIAGRALPARSALPSCTASMPDTVLNGSIVTLPSLAASYCLTRSAIKARSVARSPRQTIATAGGNLLPTAPFAARLAAGFAAGLAAGGLGGGGGCARAALPGPARQREARNAEAYTFAAT